MAKTTQENRLLELTTPLGKDVLLIRSIHGREAISQLYHYEIECFAPNETEIDFNKMIGQDVSVRVFLGERKERFFHGIVRRFQRGARGTYNTGYRIEIVPTLWLLTQRTQSRIFQQINIPDILKKVLGGLDVDYEISGTFEPRDYCVQYRETDFDFASRLMEEEAIYYFFRHTAEGHKLVVANTPQSHEALPEVDSMHFDDTVGGVDEEHIIYSWEKIQELRSGKVTLWDHCFELPHKNLEAQAIVDEDLQVGDITHKLKIAGNDKLELYDFPGAYAQRFDGVDPGGGKRAGDLQKIYSDNERTVKLRMQQETVNALNIHGLSRFLNICPGYKFDLDRHYSDNDTYTIVSAAVSIPQMGGYAGGDEDTAPPPETAFECVPYKLPFAPQRVTPKPVIHGTQTALVVGPSGEEIFTDEYGRVKVQFFWDREGQFNGDSSCWVRVATPWAGKNWGMIHIPRVTQEVVVAFEEGDPDRPIVVGSVYNADMMPPHKLPDNKTQSGVKSRSTPDAGPDNLNEIRFEDKIGKEFIFIHGEKDVHFRCKASYFGTIGGDFHENVGGESRREVKGKDSTKVGGNHSIHVLGDQTLGVDGDGRHAAAKTLFLFGNDGLRGESAANLDLRATGGDVKIQASGKIELNAPSGIGLNVGQSSITITPSSIHITAGTVHLNSASGSVTAAKVTIPEGVRPDPPAAAMMPGQTGEVDMSKYSEGAGGAGGPKNEHDPKSEENKDKTHYVEVELLDDAGQGIEGEPCEITLPNGKKAVSSTDKKGLIRIDKIDAGNCNIRWLNLDQDAVEKK